MHDFERIVRTATRVAALLVFAALLVGCAALGIATEDDLHKANAAIQSVGAAFGPAGVATSSVITGLTTAGFYVWRNITRRREMANLAAGTVGAILRPDLAHSIMTEALPGKTEAKVEKAVELVESAASKEAS